MILTGKAVEMAEGFEEVDRELNSEIFELDEGAQMGLFFITKMYERDEAFQYYIRGCLGLFIDATKKGKVKELLTDIGNLCE